jgi:hypothetical protein
MVVLLPDGACLQYGTAGGERGGFAGEIPS